MKASAQLRLCKHSPVKTRTSRPPEVCFDCFYRLIRFVDALTEAKKFGKALVDQVVVHAKGSPEASIVLFGP